MHRCLVVANQTIGAPHLADALLDRAAAAPCRFHLLVPSAHGGDQPWSGPSAALEAAERLERGLAWFRELDLDAAGEVAGHDVVEAVVAVVGRQPFEEILLSTHSPGTSRWLRWDVPRRVAAACPELPLAHVAEGARREAASRVASASLG